MSFGSGGGFGGFGSNNNTSTFGGFGSNNNNNNNNTNSGGKHTLFSFQQAPRALENGISRASIGERRAAQLQHV